MDSLTQIVLGAAVGEAILGRKVGNRAMLWGAIGGTIPDLDVLANLTTDSMSALAYHRAFTHSLTFGFLAPAILGLVVHRLYGGSDKLPWKISKPLETVLAFVAFYVLLTVGSYLMPIEVLEIPKIAAVITVVVAGIAGIVFLGQKLRRTPSANEIGSFRGWTLLFFGAIVTHPLLDCFTAYGTQILQPFTEHRATWNTISVADPLYTLPFLLLLILAARRLRGSKSRKQLNYAGLIVSSTYLLLTIFNHFNVAEVIKSSIAAQEVPARRYLISPSILNNILWTGTVQGEKDQYYFSRYSIFDKKRAFEPFQPINGRHDLLANFQGTRELEILNWFTKGYIGYMPLDSGRVQVNDLRYGVFGGDAEDPNQYIFHWIVDTTKSPLRIYQEAGPSEDIDMGEVFGDLWTRLKGI